MLRTYAPADLTHRTLRETERASAGSLSTKPTQREREESMNRPKPNYPEIEEPSEAN